MAWADMFYPDPWLPESVRDASIAVIEEGISSHYTLPVGLPRLREALAEHIREKDGIEVDASRNIIVTPGSDSGLLFAMMPFLESGDQVLVPDPGYPQ